MEQVSMKYIITEIDKKIFLAAYDADGACCYLKLLDNGSIVGNIYVGRVDNVVKGINAAFVEIADRQKCFFSLADNKHPIFLNVKKNNSVNEGDSILVRVEREAYKTKPATLTDKIELSGCYTVVSSDVRGVLLSGKLKKMRDNAQLTTLMKDVAAELESRGIKNNSTDGYGVILRSTCISAPKETVLSELTGLCDELSDVINRAHYLSPYSLVHTDKPVYVTDIAHYAGETDVEVVTDIEKIYSYVSRVFKGNARVRVRMYEDSLLPLYKLYSVEKEIDTALSRKIWLKSGGYIIIEQTEAMCVVDVNSGKGSAKTQLKTDLEAADVIMKQLILRNLSGIIVVDFINLDDEENEQLMTHLKELAKKDIVNTAVVDMTPLGLVEITRRKTGKSLYESIKSNEVE